MITVTRPAPPNTTSNQVITCLIIVSSLHSERKGERSPKQNRIPHEPEWRPPDEIRVYHDVSPG